MATHGTKTTRRAAKPAHDPKEAQPVAPAPPTFPPASAEEIRLRAYLKWEAAGKPTGDGVQFWVEAEQELLQRK
jgi:hypothetical protein